MIGQGLAYVAVAVRDVEAVAQALERDFLLPRLDCAAGTSQRRAPVFPVGQTNLALFELGDPFVGGTEKTGVHHLAVSVDDPATAGAQAAERGVPTVSGQPEAGLGGASLVRLYKFQDQNPSCEVMSRALYEKTVELCGVTPAKVRLWESVNQFAEYHGEN